MAAKAANAGDADTINPCNGNSQVSPMATRQRVTSRYMAKPVVARNGTESATLRIEPSGGLVCVRLRSMGTRLRTGQPSPGINSRSSSQESRAPHRKSDRHLGCRLVPVGTRRLLGLIPGGTCALGRFAEGEHPMAPAVLDVRQRLVQARLGRRVPCEDGISPRPNKEG